MRNIGIYPLFAAAAFLAGCGTISKPTTPPVQPSKLTITTSSLPGGTVGVAYSAAVAASGGTTPYTFKASGLPVSLSINASTGAITGTPAQSAAGIAQVAITVTDAGQPTAQTATADLSITVNATLTAQTITFANPGTQTVGTPLTLSATANSGLTVSFASTTTSVCKVSGTTATFIAAGTCSITASQAGNATYAAATPISQSFTVKAASKTAQTITFGTIPTQTVGAPLTLSATASSGLTVSFASTTTSVCTLNGTTATFIAAGTCSITASQAGNATYAAATPVSQSFTVNAAASKPTISSFTASPASITSGSSSTLSWTTSGATSIAITPGSFTSTSASGSTTVSPTATTTYTLTATNAAGSTTATAKVTVTVSGSPLTITTTSCPGGTQLETYAGCTIAASGGTPPYTYSLSTDTTDYPPLPEGMSLNASTGEITSSLIGGQGTYIPEFVVTDSTGATATQQISFTINGSNAFLATIFPSTSIFHHRVDAATTGLPVDNSPAAPMYSAYLSATVKPFFGDEYNNFPNGIPAIEVPYSQPDVTVSTTAYQSYYTSGPIPAYAPVEGTANGLYAPGGEGDMHVLVYVEAGGGNKPALYEMWQGIYEDGPWTDSSNALWLDVTSNAMTPQGNGTTDAAGLPVGPLLVNADEVIGMGTPSAPNGTIQHPIRFTLEHMLNYWVWPATETAGTGSCTATGGKSIPTESEIAQSTATATTSVPYPATCSMSGAAGEIYRLKASVATPSCASTSPQAAIIITAFRNYGIILADNGDSGGLIGTPDARWNNDDLSCLTSLILSDFEPVNVSSLMVSDDSGETGK